MTEDLSQRIYPLEAQYRERVWGGQRLKAHDPPYGEAWVAFEESRVADGRHAGRTVGELSTRYGASFLGGAVAERYGPRFPLLVKLLDCADWLSVQVHPNDEQARRLVGPEEFGKTEAWHFLEAEPGASIYAGIRPGTTREALAEAIRAGRVLDVAEQFEVSAGETVYIPSGTLHSLGPGLLLYEVQQSSDTTYRVYDWDRPATAGRKLHVEESIAVTDPRRGAVVQPPPVLEGTSAGTVLKCPYFTLDVLGVGGHPFQGDTEGRSFHLLTTTAGAVEIRCGGESARVGTNETALVAGSAGLYEVRAVGGEARALRSAVPASEAAREV